MWPLFKAPGSQGSPYLLALCQGHSVGPFLTQVGPSPLAGSPGACSQWPLLPSTPAPQQCPPTHTHSRCSSRWLRTGLNPPAGDPVSLPPHLSGPAPAAVPPRLSSAAGRTRPGQGPLTLLVASVSSVVPSGDSRGQPGRAPPCSRQGRGQKSFWRVGSPARAAEGGTASVRPGRARPGPPAEPSVKPPGCVLWDPSQRGWPSPPRGGPEVRGLGCVPRGWSHPQPPTAIVLCQQRLPGGCV